MGHFKKKLKNWFLRELPLKKKIIFLVKWLHYFDKDQLILVDGDKLQKDPAGEMIKLQKKLEVDVRIGRNSFVLNDSGTQYCLKNQCLRNTKGVTKSINGTTGISVDARKKLDKFYAPFNEKLFDLVGQRFDW